MSLTDEQCVKFLRRPGSSYDMVRAIYAAGRKAGLEDAAVKCIELMKQYRFDKHTHEGLGDIRLTIGAQEEIAAAIRALKAG